MRLHLDSADGGPQTLDGTADNLSPRGAKVVTSKHWLSPHQVCVVEFVDAAEESRARRVTAIVRWAIQEDPEASVFGLEFEGSPVDEDPDRPSPSDEPS